MARRLPAQQRLPGTLRPITTPLFLARSRLKDQRQRRRANNVSSSTGLITWKRASRWLMWPFTRDAARLDTFAARIKRAKNEGFNCGSQQGKCFRLAVKRDGFGRERVYGWLDSVIHEGRAELEAQHALEREVEAWDMSCRIAFMVEIT